MMMPFDLVSNIGGILGIFTGMSILSMCEVVQFIVELLALVICGMNRKKKKTDPMWHHHKLFHTNGGVMYCSSKWIIFHYTPTRRLTIVLKSGLLAVNHWLGINCYPCRGVRQLIEFFTIHVSVRLSDRFEVTQHKINFVKKYSQWGLNSQPADHQSHPLPLC